MLKQNKPSSAIFIRDMLQAIRFALVGSFVTVLHIIVATILIEFLYIHPSISNALAFLCSNLVSYILNTVWSFEKSLNYQSFVRFFTVSFVGFLVTVSIASFAQMMGWHYQIGIAMIVIIVPIISFIIHKKWTYNLSSHKLRKEED
ncbi:MAG: GtrA family protein [Candidatus Competibacteraceae bacterium]